MIRLYGLEKKKITSLGLGVFDGLHLGHQEIFKRTTTLLTFYPHPDLYLNKSNTLKMIMTLKELRYYVKNLLVLRFNHYISQLEPKAFLDEVILKNITPKKIIVGYDFQFGYKRQGNLSFLMRWAAENNIEVDIIPPYKIDNKPVKSSEIRKLILNNKFSKAIQLLGHPYLIVGRVIRGEGRGRKLGFPTANLHTQKNKLLPCQGVYKGNVIFKDKKKKCLIYVGKKPTFQNTDKVVEVYIPEFSGNLYDQQLHVEILEKIRDDQTFLNSDALISQIKKDLTHL